MSRSASTSPSSSAVTSNGWASATPTFMTCSTGAGHAPATASRALARPAASSPVTLPNLARRTNTASGAAGTQVMTGAALRLGRPTATQPVQEPGLRHLDHRRRRRDQVARGLESAGDHVGRRDDHCVQLHRWPSYGAAEHRRTVLESVSHTRPSRAVVAADRQVSYVRGCWSSRAARAAWATTPRSHDEGATSPRPAAGRGRTRWRVPDNGLVRPQRASRLGHLGGDPRSCPARRTRDGLPPQSHGPQPAHPGHAHDRPDLRPDRHRQLRRRPHPGIPGDRPPARPPADRGRVPGRSGGGAAPRRGPARPPGRRHHRRHDHQRPGPPARDPPRRTDRTAQLHVVTGVASDPGRRVRGRA